MSRGLYYRRDVRNKTIARKKTICRNIYCGDTPKLYEEPIQGYWYKVDGRYSKGKIHCGCSICKPSKYKGYPTVRTMRETEKFEIELRELNY